jgi:hypothetical protein
VSVFDRSSRIARMRIVRATLLLVLLGACSADDGASTTGSPPAATATTTSVPSPTGSAAEAAFIAGVERDADTTISSTEAVVAAGYAVCEILPDANSGFDLNDPVLEFDSEVGAAVILNAVEQLCPEWQERFDRIVVR